MFFQRACVSGTKASYRAAEDGSIRVHNQCETKSGLTAVNGHARVVEGSSNAKLEVSFFWPFWADYWIIGLDEKYRWAVVGNPSRKNLWILSRTPSLPPDELKAALETAREQHFDLNELRYTAQ
jgi:apolipoprotein D and lipocalin family protein